ncbi:MAG: BatA domain-containing protein [Planctomycetaceae bacterium]
MIQSFVSAQPFNSQPFAGRMYFANPWGLLGLLALPAIVAIHLYRRRFPTLYVAGAHLWGAETRVADAGRRRDRLPLTVSLLLELLAALLLSLALADPRMEETDAVHHVVAVLDDSASMQAQPAGKKSFRDQALTDLQQRVAETGRETRLTLVRTGLHPTLLGTRAMQWSEAAAALESWSPTATTLSPQSGWDEALQLVGSDGKFVFLTDREPETVLRPPPGMELVALGEPLDNLAITAARWTSGTGSGPGSLFVRVANYGEQAATVDLRGTAQKQLLFTQSIAIPAGGEIPVEVPVPAGLGRIDVQLDRGSDPLSIDNHVALIEPQSRLVKIGVDLAADSAEARLVMKALDALPGWQLVDHQEAELVIGDASQLPVSRAGLWWLGIGPLNHSEAFRKQAIDLIGPYLLERQHPLLDGLSLGGVIWGGVQATTLRLSPLISVDKTILLGRLEGTQTTAWIMNIDLSRSNLGESPDWPILLANLVELRREALPGLRRWNYRLGETVLMRVPPSTPADAELAVVLPSGRRRPLLRDRDDLVEVPPLAEAGVYRLLAGDEPLDQFSVNFFDPIESNLTALGTRRQAPESKYEPTRIRLDNPFSWLFVLGILAVLLAVLWDWLLVDRAPGLNRVAASN